MRFFTVFLLLCIQSLSHAQTTVVDSAVLKREYKDVNWQTAANFILFSPEGHQWYTQAVICTPEYSALAEAYRFKLQTGYEFKASDNWRIGLGLKLNMATKSDYIFPRLSLAHHGKLAKLDFIKEVNAEVGYSLLKNNNAYNRTALTSLLLGLGKEFNIGGSTFYTAISFKPYLYVMTKKTASDIYKNRTVDHLQWRFDFLYKISEKFRVGVYALIDADHYYTLGGVSSVTGPYPDYRLNQITPIFGLNLFCILKGDRREGYLPLWPSK